MENTREGKRFFVSASSTYRSVGHPAAGLHLVGIQAPEFQFLFEEGAAHVRRVVKLPRPKHTHTDRHTHKV